MSPRRLLPRESSPQWGFIDQALSSGTNFALTLLTLRAVGEAKFGAFSFVYLLYVLALPLVRSVGMTPFTISHSRDEPAQMLQAAARSVRYVLGVGCTLGVLCLLGAGIAGADLRGPLLALGICFPLLLVQDAVRVVLFARSEFRRATVNDGVWALLQLPVLALLVAGANRTPSYFVLAWAGSGALAGVFGLWQLRIRLRLESPRAYWSAYGELGRPLLFNSALHVLPAQLTYLLMPAVSSLSQLGAIRAAYVFFGPLNVAYTSLSMLALPHAVRLPRSGVRSLAVKLSVAMGVLSSIWAVLVVNVPDSAGRWLMGDDWAGTGRLRLLLALSLIAEGVIVGAVVALNALGQPAKMAKIRYVTAPLTLAMGVVLAALYGAVGVAAAFLIGYSLTTVLAWWQVAALPQEAAAAREPIAQASP